jgi:SAM-dependent methyltransferase
MNRKEKILRFINTAGNGIELGPSFNPIAPKKEGYRVEIIDHLSREQLVEKYRGQRVNLENIEEVDFVWQGENYTELTGKRKYYDWIIASHVIEHTPDLIGFLKNCAAILKDDGVLSLVVPDKRYCFDHYRPLTGIAKIIDSHFQKNERPTAGAVAEYFINAVANAGNIFWSSTAPENFRFIHSLAEVQKLMGTVVQEKTYIDVHAWCFVPHSFRLIIQDLFGLGFIPFQELGFYPTEGHEFYITLGRQGKGLDRSRLEMVQMIESELMARGPLLVRSRRRIKGLLKRFIPPFIRRFPGAR